MRGILFRFAAVLGGIVLCALVGEIALRCVYAGRSHFKAIVYDEVLGWRSARDVRYGGYAADCSGLRYEVECRLDGEGFRMFGDPGAANRSKVFFLGDSFTQAVEVSGDKTYYGVIGELLGVEVFAYGAGGFGTLQQYMVLDRYVDQIAPDMVVLQFCSNDFINNHYELELRSVSNNNGMRRPYLNAEGEVFYSLPKRSLRRLRSFANRYSRFLHFVFKQINRIEQGGGVEEVIQSRGWSDPLFLESVDITGELLSRIKSRLADGTSFYVFMVSTGSPWDEAIRRLCEMYEISFIDGVAEAVSAAAKNEVAVYASDGAHWSEHGHKIAGGVIARYLSENE